MLRVVVLPAPLWPSRQKISPRFTQRETPRTAWTPTGRPRRATALFSQSTGPLRYRLARRNVTTGYAGPAYAASPAATPRAKSSAFASSSSTLGSAPSAAGSGAGGAAPRAGRRRQNEGLTKKRKPLPAPSLPSRAWSRYQVRTRNTPMLHSRSENVAAVVGASTRMSPMIPLSLTSGARQRSRHAKPGPGTVMPCSMSTFDAASLLIW